MSKILKIVHEDKCNGCEMCVMEAQCQLKKVGLEGSYIRIMRNIERGTKFEVCFDPNVQELNIGRVVAACPREVFEETEERGS
jgi:Fe-S-cluster-containing hydrogenase component 2